MTVDEAWRRFLKENNDTPYHLGSEAVCFRAGWEAAEAQYKPLHDAYIIRHGTIVEDNPLPRYEEHPSARS
jgi:hypothetical protein